MRYHELGIRLVEKSRFLIMGDFGTGLSSVGECYID
jgi:hypothetical protein